MNNSNISGGSSNPPSIFQQAGRFPLSFSGVRSTPDLLFRSRALQQGDPQTQLTTTNFPTPSIAISSASLNYQSAGSLAISPRPTDLLGAVQAAGNDLLDVAQTAAQEAVQRHRVTLAFGESEQLNTNLVERHEQTPSDRCRQGWLKALDKLIPTISFAIPIAIAFTTDLPEDSGKWVYLAVTLAASASNVGAMYIHGILSREAVQDGDTVITKGRHLVKFADEFRGKRFPSSLDEQLRRCNEIAARLQGFLAFMRADGPKSIECAYIGSGEERFSLYGATESIIKLCRDLIRSLQFPQTSWDEANRRFQIITVAIDWLSRQFGICLQNARSGAANPQQLAVPENVSARPSVAAEASNVDLTPPPSQCSRLSVFSPGDSYFTERARGFSSLALPDRQRDVVLLHNFPWQRESLACSRAASSTAFADASESNAARILGEHPRYEVIDCDGSDGEGDFRALADSQEALQTSRLMRSKVFSASAAQLRSDLDPTLEANLERGMRPRRNEVAGIDLSRLDKGFYGLYGLAPVEGLGPMELRNYFRGDGEALAGTFEARQQDHRASAEVAVKRRREFAVDISMGDDESEIEETSANAADLANAPGRQNTVEFSTATAQAVRPSRSALAL